MIVLRPRMQGNNIMKRSMASVMCLYSSMQEENIAEYTNAKCHMCKIAIRIFFYTHCFWVCSRVVSFTLICAIRLPLRTCCPYIFGQIHNTKLTTHVSFCIATTINK